MRKEIITALLTVVLVIICIATFIYYHAGTLFYTVAVLAFIAGFANAWFISREETEIEERRHSDGNAKRSRKSSRRRS
jgi:4-hydroxybenzoate polyprenyltransferase